jgi:hypothetical protein
MAASDASAMASMVDLRNFTFKAIESAPLRHRSVHKRFAQGRLFFSPIDNILGKSTW